MPKIKVADLEPGTYINYMDEDWLVLSIIPTFGSNNTDVRVRAASTGKALYFRSWVVSLNHTFDLSTKPPETEQ